MIPLTVQRDGVRAQSPRVVAWIAAAGAFAAAVIPFVSTLGDVPRADVTIENPSRWDVHVEVLFDEHTRLGIATVPADSSMTVSEVVAPHEEWTLVLSAWGHDRRVVVRDAAHVRVLVPDELVGDLEAAGAPPSP